MKVLLINSVCGIGSTGRICTDLAQKFEAAGDEVKIAYGRKGTVPEQFQKYAVRIGTDWDCKMHAIQTRLFDTHGFGSKHATKKFLQWAEEYKPDLVWLHNIHGYYINVLDGTDVIVLTLFSTLSNVSIYSVYYLVVKGVKTLFLSLTNGIESLMGDLWAKQESTKLYSLFGWVEWTIHTGTTLVFSCTAALIVPFIRIYTAGVHDANYVQPLFATLLVLANALHCLRLPYNIMVLAAGHYKQTQNNYIIAAILNVVISVIAVQHAGIIGVAIGTLVAMTYQTFWLSRYISKNLVNWPASHIFKQFLIDLVESFLISFSPKLYVWNVNTYIQWITLSCFTLLIGLFIVIAINTVFYRDKVVLLLSKTKRKGAN